jgi:hypothetical protein
MHGNSPQAPLPIICAQLQGSPLVEEAAAASEITKAAVRVPSAQVATTLLQANSPIPSPFFAHVPPQVPLAIAEVLPCDHAAIPAVKTPPVPHAAIHAREQGVTALPSLPAHTPQPAAQQVHSNLSTPVPRLTSANPEVPPAPYANAQPEPPSARHAQSSSAAPLLNLDVAKASVLAANTQKHVDWGDLDSEDEEDMPPVVPQLAGEVATEHLTASQEDVYCIVACLLSTVNCRSAEVETLMTQIILDEHSDHDAGIARALEEICHPLFFTETTRGSSHWPLQDPTSIICNWRWYADTRAYVSRSGHLDQDGHPIHFSPEDVKRCHDLYQHWFKTREATPEQLSKPASLRSCAQAKMRKDCGSRFACFALWEVGLPRASESLRELLQKSLAGAHATELHPLPTSERQALTEFIFEIVLWMTAVGRSVQAHKESHAYKEVARRAGKVKHQSGLSTEERAAKVRIQKLRKLQLRGRHLASTWSYDSGWEAYSANDAAILRAFWAQEYSRNLAALQLQYAPPASTFRCGQIDSRMRRPTGT